MAPPALKIIFAGTPEFAAVALQALLASPHQVVAVYTQPDRPAGRGRQLKPSAVKALALQHGIAIEQPVSLKTPEAVNTLAHYQADLMIVAAYGLILPTAVLTTPRLGCLNIHASLLPRWRGAAPIQRAILAGDSHTGITIMQMDAGLDTGAMLLSKPLPIVAGMNAGQLHDQLAKLGASTLLECIELLQQQRLLPQPQDDSQATYAKKLDKDEAWIDWTQAASRIDRQVRAFNPWPVAQTKLAEQIIRIWQAVPVAHRGVAGTILHSDKNGIIVACGEAALSVQCCQLPGGKPLSVTEILNGHAALFAPGKHFTA
jgi:methionyl-tRNA formyltransferase